MSRTHYTLPLWRVSGGNLRIRQVLVKPMPDGRVKERYGYVQERIGNWRYSFFDTEAEARAHALKEAQDSVAKYQRGLKIAQSQLRSAEHLLAKITATPPQGGKS